MNVKAEKERAGLTRRGDVPSSPELVKLGAEIAARCSQQAQHNLHSPHLPFQLGNSLTEEGP